MIEILIALISMTGLSIYGSVKGDSDNFFIEILCPVIAVFGFIGLFIYSFVAWDYFAAEYKRDIINREYGSSYTQLEVFYASDVIDTVRELNRKRIEINGDLINGE